jgi:hypothetical protein
LLDSGGAVANAFTAYSRTKGVFLATYLPATHLFS